MGLNITRKFIQSRFEDRMLFLARYLALNSELGILIGQTKALQRLAENLLSEKDVVKVSVRDEKGNILANASKGPLITEVGEIYSVEVPVSLSRTRSYPWGFDLDKKGDVIGQVAIEYSTEGINRLLSTMKNRFLWLSIGLACLCVMIFYFISRSIVAPVTRLAVTARHVAKGDLKLRVRPDSLPETRELGLAFNAMLDFVESGQTALKEANEEIIRQKTLAELGKFSLMVAHEVKNPLSIIKSSMDLLKKYIQPSVDKTPVVYIEDEIQRLNQLIEDFLLFARPAVPAFREVDLNVMLKETVDRFDLQINGHPVSIHPDIPDTPCQANADPDLMTRAIGNILKNSVEANGRRGSIVIRAVQKGAKWIVECEDEGPGIKPENLEKIFDPFYTTRSKGTGLGLTFVSQVLTAHGGRVRAENRPDGGGARFVIELPLKPLNTEPLNPEAVKP